MNLEAKFGPTMMSLPPGGEDSDSQKRDSRCSCLTVWKTEGFLGWGGRSIQETNHEMRGSRFCVDDMPTGTRNDVRLDNCWLNLELLSVHC